MDSFQIQIEPINDRIEKNEMTQKLIPQNIYLTVKHKLFLIPRFQIPNS